MKMNAMWAVAVVVGWLSCYAYMKHGAGKAVAEARREEQELLIFGAAWIAGLNAGWEGSRMLQRGAPTEEIAAAAQRQCLRDMTNQLGAGR